ncbi:MAG: DUF2934 domain-containing protein [Candidatus Omnitrophota bacterium]
MAQEHKVRKLAYWLYLLKGKKSGDDLGDWLKAEKTVACFEDFIAKCAKYTSIVIFVLTIIVLLAYFILPFLGYRVIIESR